MKKRPTKKARRPRLIRLRCEMKLFQDNGKAHIRGAIMGRARCGESLELDAPVKPLDIRVKDICEDCLAGHMRRHADND